MEIELISRETIKPSSATPSHLKNFPLSFLDHIVFRNYVPVIFFYQNGGTSEYCDHIDNGPTKVCDQRSKISMLQKSLSEVLSRYYPFAGRIRDQLSIECNDQGVSFLVTRINSKLSKILNNPSEAKLKPLFPDELQWKEVSSSASASIIAIQIIFFSCGGMAISVCMCHKVGDAATMLNFVNDWATMNRESHRERELPFPFLDAGPSVFPQGDLPVYPEVVFVKANTVCKRFVFQGSNIESLKAMVSSHKVQNPTRVEVITALIYKCAVSALRLTFKTSSFRTAVNLRKRMVPPMPDKSIGNLIWFLFMFRPFMDNKETELHDLVIKMKEGLSEFCDMYAKKFGGKEKDLSFISECLTQATSVPMPSDSNDHTLFFYSSWCKFPSYEVDFGWGKPIWVTSIGSPVRNSITLMDTRDGNGIEALVNMDEQDMALFERDVELLQYASLNPTIGYANGIYSSAGKHV